ncbi:MAG: 23S rRNA (guanosine(2251)-2'-O)-methyltransferase RlmB, partial [Gammaproteobacteria bacterium]|nr:23S rRNA (guanosine(2251)-2'-O)-methyltransferase RlmB [Gammaproteobacteria bacterium]
MFDSMITLYGRKPVLEILLDPDSSIFRLHLSESNQRGDTITQIRKLADKRNITIVTHPKEALSRISKNARQDQGVAIDISPPKYLSVDQIIASAGQILALDGITNPQNLGMIIRSVAASPMDGLLLPRKGCAKIDPLVHKASAGTLI